MKSLFAIAALVISQLGMAQKTIPLQEFTAIGVADMIEVTLVKGTENKLVTSSDTAKLVIENEKGKLHLRVNGKPKKNEKIVATVYYTGALSALAAGSGGTIKSTDVFTGSLTGELNVAASSGSDINIKAGTDKLNAAVASGAVVTLSGKSGEFTAAVSSGAVLHARSLVTANTTIAVSSGGVGSVNATDEAMATVSAGGDVKIYGNPKDVKQTKSAGGSITVVR